MKCWVLRIRRMPKWLQGMPAQLMLGTMAVMMTGVAIKLVLYSPTGRASTHSVTAQRLVMATELFVDASDEHQHVCE